MLASQLRTRPNRTFGGVAPHSRRTRGIPAGTAPGAACGAGIAAATRASGPAGECQWRVSG